MATPTNFSRSADTPAIPRRVNTTLSQRPSTSSGETFEPKSELLRTALQDRRAMPIRAQSTTPRRARGGFRSQNYQDPWVPSDEEDSRDERLSRSTGRLPPRRRNTDFNFSTLRSALSPSHPPSPTLGVGLREQETVIDKLKKENWDLKHRIALQQERSKKLEADLETALDRLRQSDSLFHKNASLEKENGRLKMKLAAAQDEYAKLNDELEQWHEEAVQELEQKDNEIRDRHLAIEEAAGWIQRLEIENQTLKQSLQQQQTTGNQADSDYFSGDQDGVPSTSTKPTKPSPLTPAADSDYFSADTSPNLTPKTPRQRPVVTTDEEARQSNARLSALSFNRELGLRSITSKDSLFGNFLESLAPSATPARTLRRRCSRPSLTPTQEVSSPASSEGTAPAWSTSRPLRELYKAGDLGRQVATPEQAVAPRPLSPSTASIMTRDLSAGVADADADADSDIFSRGGTTRPSSPSTTINDGLADMPQDSPSKPAAPRRLPRPAAGLPPPPPPPAPPAGFNYDRWPRRLPDWPPSASLTHRDALFRADAVGGLFAPGPPRRNPARYAVQAGSPATAAAAAAAGSPPQPLSPKIDPDVPPRGSSLRVSSGKHSPRHA